MNEIEDKVLERFKEYMKIQMRNAEIVRLRADGWTLQKIGDKFGLTRERVRQIASSYAKKEKESL